MKGRRVVLLVALALAGSAALGAEPVGAQADGAAPLALCAARLKAGVRGLAAVRAVCPDIDRTVAALTVGAALPADWPTRVDATALADLSALEARYGGRPFSVRGDDALLRSIASRLGAAARPSSWWQRLLAWLTRALAPNRGHEPARVGKPPAWMLDPRVWWWARHLMLGLILVILAVIVLREVRAAGSRGGARKRPKSPGRACRGPQAVSNDAEVTEPRLTDGPPHPALLLRVLIGALRRSRRLEHDRSLTWREIAERARFDSPAQRASFVHIAVLAEHELYGPPGWAPQVPDELRRSTEVLREQLLIAPPAAPAAAP